MRNTRTNPLQANWLHRFFLASATAVLLQICPTASIGVPGSNCYALDNSGHIYDFSSWIGQPFEYEGKDSDLVVRFCKDVESRSQTGYLDFGRFHKVNYFVAGSGHVNFVQEFYNGDLINCEHSYDKMGRTAKVYNGMTQLGFEKSHHEFSFKTEQSQVALYMTAIASLSNLVQKPTVKVSPELGLEVSLSGSGATGSQPTTLSPTIFMVAWRCEEARDTPYEVEITVPVVGYEPIQFTLTKMCGYRQHKEGDSMRGWAVFGVICSMYAKFNFIFLFSPRGLDALPGMSILSACLETFFCVFGYISKNTKQVSGGGHGYLRPGDMNSTYVNQASWERPPVSAQGTGRTSERNYGSI
ncbi:hypothetical protein RHGRI_023686 [Rhododendron griersonianum]|uniref:Uncharacterized protein n=1 Tax=Rhododendron griersonianum TaxID=479676 RepID=A0AAV6J7Q4_9ERIC|nr:hypothetical protein RHGRI_023686 [Rhododendron griersonianum]